MEHFLADFEKNRQNNTLWRFENFSASQILREISLLLKLISRKILVAGNF